MPLEARFLHWQQAPDDELLSQPCDVLTEAPGEVAGPWSMLRALAQEEWETPGQAVLREDEPWASV